MKEELKFKFRENFGINDGSGRYYEDIEIGTKIREIIEWIDENFVPIDAGVSPKIAGERNGHNLDIIHFGCCTKCGYKDLRDEDCKYYNDYVQKEN